MIYYHIRYGGHNLHLKFMNSQLKLSSIVDMTSWVEMIITLRTSHLFNLNTFFFVTRINLNTSIKFLFIYLYKAAEK